MHALACRSVALSTSRRIGIQACRYIAGRRFSQAAAAARLFGTSSSNFESEKDAAQGDFGTLQEGPQSTQPPSETIPQEQRLEVANSPDQPPEPSDNDSSNTPDTAAAKGFKGPYGSAKRRMRRNASQRGPAPITAPPQFVQNNIRLFQPLAEDEDAQKEINGGNASGQPDEDVYPNATVGGGVYQINRDVLFEIQASVNAGLRPTWAGEADSVAASRPHLLLQSPKNGGNFFLDAVVENAAKRCRADVITLEPQDIAEFVADNQPMNSSPFTTGTLRTLGYDAHVIPGHESAQKEGEDEGGIDDEGAYDDYEMDRPPIPRPGKSGMKGSSFSTQPMVISSVSGNLNDVWKSLGLFNKPTKEPKGDDPTTAAGQLHQPRAVPPLEHTLVANLIENLIQETEMARYAPSPETANEPRPEAVDGEAAQVARKAQPKDTAESLSRGLILHIKDYLEIYSTSAGSGLMRAIHELVLRKRKEGKNILLIGTTSAEDLLPVYTKDGWKDLQNETTSGPYRTIITPCASKDAEDIFRSDDQIRIREINVRHLQDMIRRITFDPEHTDNICKPGNLQLQSASTFSSGLTDEVWTFERVQRLAHTAIGLMRHGEDMTVEHIEWAVSMIMSSDQAKVDWLNKDKKQSPDVISSLPDSKESQEDRMKKLRKQCNAHEKKLLGGVIDSTSIKITFSDVRASESTIDALKNLTSLSLTRPEAFTYGVLAAEKIPGLLLYGPPGTGKTLLAKAVAKESGATVLEVSGSDVYDMYVGEGEKNVRAIFSLAKKIPGPTIVFIDEADAIFGQRSNSGTRTTHREIINQFLREWDGMSEKSAFIMVATNRPFDLDDAVLRRLPRRLLVDLPTEKDREAILKIHLKEEQLAEDVDLSKLARRTPYYSGSDLKNVCVAAALTCVREETDAALKSAHEAVSATSIPSISASTTSKSSPSAPSTEGNTATSETQRNSTLITTGTTQAEPKQPYQYPAKRTIQLSHVEKALAEISASISDDMSSLTAIRKFDEKYGDRKGRKKRTPGGYGFGTLSERERDKLEDGRVRTEL